MYIVMNRFKIKQGSEDTFIEIWRNRDSHLAEVQGFIRFYLLKGTSEANYTLFSSFTEWQSKTDFEMWIKSDQFKMAHRNAEGKPKQDIYLEAPHIECFEVVL